MLSFIQCLKILAARFRWSCQELTLGEGVIFNCPVIFSGKGTILVQNDVVFGHKKSPGFFSEIIQIEARASGSTVVIGSESVIGNGVSIIAFFSSVELGSRCLFGSYTIAVDTDFHPLAPDERRDAPKSNPVFIGENVTTGFRSTILKGVEIGDNCFIGAGAVVAKNIPSNQKVWGNPAIFSPI